jgi:hypothetical protein
MAGYYLLVIQTGGMAAVTITFARYFIELTGMHAPAWLTPATPISPIKVFCGKKTGRGQSAAPLAQYRATFQSGLNRNQWSWSSSLSRSLS